MFANQDLVAAVQPKQYRNQWSAETLSSVTPITNFYSRPSSLVILINFLSIHLTGIHLYFKTMKYCF